MGEQVLVVTADGIATVTLNRPEKRNALSLELRHELASTFQGLGADPDVAVVVVTGAGTAFCAGMDRTQFGGDDANRRELWETSAALFDTLSALPRPVIAAVNGPALGGGFALAAVCDVRFASPAATFGHPEIRLGIPPSYAALLRALPDQIAREMAFTGRVLGAEEALALGIVRDVAEDVVARARDLAEEMAQHGAKVLEQTKRLMIEAGGGVAEAAWEAEMKLFRKALFGEA
ncbi:MAG: enoyl-CoA hydratase/isomerase family protein [Actinomycetota bacterium]